MNIFIHNTYIKILKKGAILEEKIPLFDWQEESIDFSKLKGKIAIRISFTPILAELVKLIAKNRFPELEDLYIYVSDKNFAKKVIKNEFKTLEAAGGVVCKESKTLVIHRLGRWDLPKGKLEAGETFETAAVREVAEECSVKVQLKEKIITTWHYYQDFRGKDILKKTKWYAMDCLDDSEMKPQVEEDIEQILWMNKEELKEAQKNTYKTIELVLRKTEDLQTNSYD